MIKFKNLKEVLTKWNSNDVVEFMCYDVEEEVVFLTGDSARLNDENVTVILDEYRTLTLNDLMSLCLQTLRELNTVRRQNGLVAIDTVIELDIFDTTKWKD